MKTLEIRGIRVNYNPGDEFVAKLPYDEHRDYIYLSAKGNIIDDGSVTYVVLSDTARARCHALMRKGYRLTAYHPDDNTRMIKIL